MAQPTEEDLRVAKEAIEAELGTRGTTGLEAQIGRALDQLEVRIASAIAAEREKAAKLSVNESHLLSIYRENLCGDPDCEGSRFSAAQSVFKGAVNHKEIAEIVHSEMTRRSEAGIGDERFAAIRSGDKDTSTKPKPTMADVRRAVADYMYSEGCSCCRNNEDHEIHAARLAKLLRVPKYSDGSGFDFLRYRTKDKQ